MSAIGPGDYVECIDASRGDSSGEVSLVQGGIYQVEDLYHDGVNLRTGRRETGLFLRGLCVLDWLGRRLPYRLERFRPIYRPKREIIEQLKQPAPSEREPEHA